MLTVSVLCIFVRISCEICSDKMRELCFCFSMSLTSLLNFVSSHGFPAWISQDAVFIQIPYTHATLGNGLDTFAVRTLAEARNVLGY